VACDDGNTHGSTRALFKDGTVDVRRSLYVADSLLGLGIASSIVPYSFKESDLDKLTDDMLGWIFDAGRAGSPYGLAPRNLFTDPKAKIPFTRVGIPGYGARTLETQLNETLKQNPGFPEAFKKNVATRMLQLTRSEGGLRPIDVYMLMRKVQTRQQQIADSNEAYKHEPTFSTWPPAPGSLSPIDNLLHADSSQLPTCSWGLRSFYSGHERGSRSPPHD